MSKDAQSSSPQAIGSTSPFNSLSEPGHYALDVSGIDTLFIRVPGDAMKANRSPLIQITDQYGNAPAATKVGRNFDQSLTKARMKWADSN